jgi:hypothetical protein
MLDLPLPFRPVMELNDSSLHCAISQVLHFHPTTAPVEAMSLIFA